MWASLEEVVNSTEKVVHTYVHNLYGQTALWKLRIMTALLFHLLGLVRTI